MDNENKSTHSSSFICSLGDDELIEYINKLSQERKKLVETDVDTDIDTEEDGEEDKVIKKRVPSSPVASSVPQKPDLITASDATSDEILGSITLAQPGPSSEIEELLFGDYETYFKQKKIKQQLADDEYRKWDEERRLKQGKSELTYPPIFRGCTIHVNGRTDPDISQLHKLIVLYGGVFLHYLGAKGNATHIIASKLTPRKHIEFRNYKVVKPQWIVDSVSQRKLLPWMDYQIINMEFGQKKINFQRLEDAPQFPTEDDEVANDMVIDEKEAIIDSKHPGFLKFFFSKSRLHHLSSWKADLKYEFLQKALQRQTSTNTGYDHEARKIFHIDFDCFFATVSALNTPNVDNLKDPVAVTHGGGSSDVASCNYVARKYGVKNGMWVSTAKKLCPNLICLDYNFAEYERISRIFYDFMIDLKCDAVLPVSVDEVLLDVSTLCEKDDAKTIALAEKIREFIFQKTHCTVSVGAASNVLLAKLALRKSKPDGVFHLSKKNDVNDFLRDIPIRDLPSVGYSICNKLRNEYQLKDITVGFLQKIEKAKLINLFGIKTGTKLYEFSRGIDETDINIAKNPGEYTRKSVSIDINWGIRFENIFQIDLFLLQCAKEMHERLLKIKMMGSSVTLKLAQRAASAPIEPPKYLGCGQCDYFSKSARFGVATREIGLISSECKALYRTLNVPPLELRGVSIMITHLVEDGNMEKQLQNQRTLPFAKIDKEQYLVNNNLVIDFSSSSPRKSDVAETTQYDVPSDVDSSMLKVLPDDIREAIELKKRQLEQPVASVPAQSQIDWEIFKKLPIDIQRELKAELQKRDIPVLKYSPSKRKSPSKFHLQPIFSKSGDEPKMIRVMSPTKKISPRKKFKSVRSPTPPVAVQDLDIDQEVFEELPSFVKRDLLEDLQQELMMVNNQRQEKLEYEKLEDEIEKALNREKPRKMIRLTRALFEEMSDGKDRPFLQRKDITGFKDVKLLLEEWVSRTITTGPHEEDFEELVLFFKKLLKLLNISSCINYLKIIHSSIKIEQKLLQLRDDDEGLMNWQELLLNLQNLVDDKCFEQNITYSIL